MLIKRIKFAAFGVSIALTVGLSGCTAVGNSVGNIVTGEGFPNPNPSFTNSWGELPEGRNWGSTAGIDIDPIDGHIWAYERCGSGDFRTAAPLNCENNPVAPIFKFDRHTGEVLANFGAGLMITPHGIHVDHEGNVWVTDFANNTDETKGQQVHKFSPDGELLMSLGIAGKRGNDRAHFNQPNDVIVAADGSIFVSDGHSGQGMTTMDAIEEGKNNGFTARIIKFDAQGNYIKEWGQLGVRHGEFRTPHAMEIDSQDRLWVADRGNHRIEIFDQDGNYLESRYSYGRISGLFITEENMVYAIDSESNPIRQPNWVDGVRIGPLNEDRLVGFIPGYQLESRVYQGTLGEGIAVDADGNVFVAEGPDSLPVAGGSFTKFTKR